ncbi:MAG: NAD(P)H-hydrate dehydratase [Elusimicrobiaceae bacterium]|nr:NAD(P)H-hydrate dehydratase [Elusimicrobiaceae bacterium]
MSQIKKITKSFFKKNFPKRPKDSYKNLNGKVFIFAGSKTMPGAAVLCAKAAYQAGAGFVSLAVPKEILPACLEAVPEALFLQISKNPLKEIITYLKQMPHDVLLVGPGLTKERAKILLPLLKQTNLPAVIDGDALNALALVGLKKLPKSKEAKYILTPHAGEAERLLKQKLIGAEAALILSEKSGAVSLFKGPETKVALGKEVWQNTTGNEGLAKAGSGDTLAGIIAGIYAQLLKRNQKKATLTSALLGVYLHGKAADFAIKKYSKTALMASQVCAEIPSVLRENSL